MTKDSKEQLSQVTVGFGGFDQDAKFGPEFFDKFFSEAVAVAEKRNVPLYCGEYGVIDQAPLPDTLAWLKDIHECFEKFGIGRQVLNEGRFWVIAVKKL